MTDYFVICTETNARLAIESDGSILWGDGGAQEFDTVLRRQVSRTIPWDPPPLGPGKAATQLVSGVGSAQPGDIVTAGHDGIGLGLALLGANVVGKGQVQVILRNVGDGQLDVKPGLLRVAVAIFEYM
eukprot:SAG22_NODE_551_length_9178_cov_3.565371_3_plen_128_part_00